MNLYEIKALTAHNKINDLANKTAVTLSHTFADNTARDTYFTANPTELVDNLFIKVGAGYQQYAGSAWEEATAVVADLSGIESELSNLATQKAEAQEIIDARQGEASLGAKITKVGEQINSLDAEVTAIPNQTYITEKAKTVDLNQTNNDVNATNLRIDNLVIPISPENANIEVTDAHNSIVKDKNFASLKDRFEENESEYVERINSELSEEHILRELPNSVKDEEINGVITKRVGGRIFLNGNLAWDGFSTTLANTYRVRLPNYISDGVEATFNNAIAYCVDGDFVSQVSTSAYDERCLILFTKHIYLRVEKTKIDAMPSGGTLEGFKEYLNKYPLSLIYELISPKTVTYPSKITANTEIIINLAEQAKTTQSELLDVKTIVENISEITVDDNSIGIDKLFESELMTDYVVKDTSVQLPTGLGNFEVALSEKGSVFATNGNMIDIIGMTDGVYVESGLTVEINGNEIKVNGTASTGKYFKLSGGSGFIPTNAGLDVRDYILPYSPSYCFGLYDINKVSGEDFSVIIRSTVSSNYASVNTSESNPYDNLTEQSLFGDMCLYVAVGQVVNISFKLFLMPTLYDVANIVSPNTKIINDVIKTRVNSPKYILSDKTGVVKELVNIYSNLSQQDVATYKENSIYVESHIDYFYYYIKGSNKDSNRYLRYRFEQYINPATNANGWVQRVVDAVELVDGIWNVLYPVIKEGEWEMAVKIKDRVDFIGCKNHGSEINTYEKFYIDGNSWTPDETSFYCKEIKIVEKSNMYDPADEVTLVGKHRKDYTITIDGINLKQKIEWLVGNTMDYSYLGMLPILRGNDVTTTYQITAFAYENDTYDEVDVSAGGHSARTPVRHEPTKWWLYSNSTGISAEIEALFEPRLAGCSSYIQNTVDNYNKVYFSFCNIDDVVTIGDIWKAENNFKLNISL